MGEQRQNTFHACAKCNGFPCACHLPRPALPPEFYEAMAGNITMKQAAKVLLDACRREATPWPPTTYVWAFLKTAAAEPPEPRRSPFARPAPPDA